MDGDAATAKKSLHITTFVSHTENKDPTGNIVKCIGESST